MDTSKKVAEPVNEETTQILNHLYASVPTSMRLPDGNLVDVPEGGSVGLLAAGYKGIIAWRKKREQVYGTKYHSPYLQLIEKIKNSNKKEGENEQ
jgi:hypothetical protein